ncbi:MAG: hypothetical protein INH41_12585 [Myxococcaceae bacterium]|nr:hypothetical protein [Myxococcaceae bacterium]
MLCPECGARGGHALGCNRSEFDLRPAPVPVPARPEAFEPTRALPESRRLAVFPLVFVAMWLVSATDMGWLLRLAFGMWLHELGHASAAWLSGTWAVPLPWVTYAFGRSWLVSALVFTSLLTLATYGRRRGEPALVVIPGAFLALAAVAHLLPASTQAALSTFAGDGGAMLYGALLASAYLVRSPNPLFRRGLRVGWLVIGAASWADATRVWWEARKDPAKVPFGVETSGFGASSMPSDASRLVDEAGWDERTMVNRFLLVAALSLAGSLLAFAAALKRARAEEAHGAPPARPGRSGPALR